MSQHKAKKHLGQNFLVDKYFISKIVDVINISDRYGIVEIGPGLGALTQYIITHCKKLNVIEYDHDIIPILRQNCQHLGSLNIYHQDVLSFNFNELYNKEQKKLIIAGNLPYNISSPILFYLSKFTDIISHTVFMLQKEVVQRICASPGTKQYGRMSVMLQYVFDTEALFEVPPEAFNPKPKVVSQIVRLTPKNKIEHKAKDIEHLSQIVKAAFSQRRKTIKNTLKNIADLSILESSGIPPNNRPETISVDQYVTLSNAIIAQEE